MSSLRARHVLHRLELAGHRARRGTQRSVLHGAGIEQHQPAGARQRQAELGRHRRRRQRAGRHHGEGVAPGAAAVVLGALRDDVHVRELQQLGQLH
jgi:hypothetical protein